MRLTCISTQQTSRRRPPREVLLPRVGPRRAETTRFRCAGSNFAKSMHSHSSFSTHPSARQVFMGAGVVESKHVALAEEYRNRCETSIRKAFIVESCRPPHARTQRMVAADLAHIRRSYSGRGPWTGRARLSVRDEVSVTPSSGTSPRTAPPRTQSWCRSDLGARNPEVGRRTSSTPVSRRRMRTLVIRRGYATRLLRPGYRTSTTGPGHAAHHVVVDVSALARAAISLARSRLVRVFAGRHQYALSVNNLIQS